MIHGLIDVLEIAASRASRRKFVIQIFGGFFLYLQYIIAS
jgi:hypothetical protein